VHAWLEHSDDVIRRAALPILLTVIAVFMLIRAFLGGPR
jgi:hypothetical protein